MKRCHHLGAFADRRGDALDLFRAHVADDEDTAVSRFQRMTPGVGFRSGEDEALGV
jgi:hypothetical protein